MPEITTKEAKEFLNQISEKDNIAIIHHDDGDGFCSAILFNNHCQNKGAITKTFPYEIGRTKLKNLPLKKFNKIILTDISTKDTQNQFDENLLKKQIFYTDHHPKFPLPPQILSLLTADKGYIPSSRTAYELTKIKKFIGLIGTVSDMAQLYEENTKFINSFLKEEKLTLETFEKDFVHPISDTIICLKETPEKIFPTLSKINSLEDIKKLKKYSNIIQKELKKYEELYEKSHEEFGDISFFQYTPKLKISKPLINIITRKYPEKIHIFLTPKEGKINISSRDQSEKVGTNILLEAATKNLPNSVSGGHIRASGGQIQKKDLEKFKQNIKDFFKK